MAAPPQVPLLEYPRWLRTSPRPEGGTSSSGGLTDEWYAQMRELFSQPADREMIEGLIADQVVVTAYDSIVFLDEVYRDGRWTTQGWRACAPRTSGGRRFRTIGTSSE